MKGQGFRTVPDSKPFAANSVPDAGSKGTTLMEISIDSATYAAVTKRDSGVASLISEVLHDRLVILPGVSDWRRKLCPVLMLQCPR